MATPPLVIIRCTLLVTYCRAIQTVKMKLVNFSHGESFLLNIHVTVADFSSTSTTYWCNVISYHSYDTYVALKRCGVNWMTRLMRWYTTGMQMHLVMGCMIYYCIVLHKAHPLTTNPGFHLRSSGDVFSETAPDKQCNTFAMTVVNMYLRLLPPK